MPSHATFRALLTKISVLRTRSAPPGAAAVYLPMGKQTEEEHAFQPPSAFGLMAPSVRIRCRQGSDVDLLQQRDRGPRAAERNA